MNILKLANGILTIILFLVTIFCGINFNPEICLFVSILSSFTLILWTKGISGNYTNISFFFVVFDVLYGISGPVNAQWGEGLQPLFSTPYNTNAFLISYSVANIGLVAGIMIYNIIRGSNVSNTLKDSIEAININKKRLLNAAMIMVFLASAFELINLYRIGGFSTLLSGKAIYQDMSSSLTLTLPSSEVIIIAFAFMGLYLGFINYEAGSYKNCRLSIIQFLLFSLPFLLINIILGKRGKILDLFISLIVGITFFKPLKSIKPKLMIILVVFYILMSFLYANRALVFLIQDDPNYFIETAFDKERMIAALNPGRNEFGTTFGNYSEYYSKYKDDFEPKLGETYIKGLALSIPSFIYPFTKPQQITYVFRDEFFASEASRSRIAGTAFSSILEAYMNFKQFGVFFVYLLVGVLLQLIDSKYKNKNIFYMILYITIIPVTVSFHRSAFGDILSSVTLYAALIYIVSNFFRNNKPRNINLLNGYKI